MSMNWKGLLTTVAGKPRVSEQQTRTRRRLHRAKVRYRAQLAQLLRGSSSCYNNNL